MVAGTLRFANKAGATKMTQTSMTAGIDTSKANLDIAVHDRADLWQVDNTPTGWRLLVAEFCKAGVTRVGIEASGGYERGVVEHLRTKGFTVLVPQPIQVKSLCAGASAAGQERQARCILIAARAASIEQPRIRPDERLAKLAGLLTFVEQIEEDIVRFKTRLEQIEDPRLRRMVLVDIARLKARKAELLRIATTLRAHDDLARRLALVLSVPGLGERTALALIVRMPELGRLTREEAASLASLAPYDDDSGKHEGHRFIAGGRGRLRRALFAATLPAAFRWNKALIALYQRLIERGKAHKIALIACARRLLIYANTVVQRGTPWIDKPAIA